MMFSINLDIELTDEELKWLKDKFLPNRKTHNILFDSEQYGSISFKKNPVLKTLTEKNIILIDSLSNANLTQIGHKILDQFDRDKKLNELLDEK